MEWKLDMIYGENKDALANKKHTLEEGSRSKERYFSPRDKNNDWDVAEQSPEFWNQYKTNYAKGTHVRVHPLLDWTELDIWEYIKKEYIPVVSLYFDQGDGIRSGKRSRIKTIEAFHAPKKQEVTAGMATGFTLEEQIYIKRGELMTINGQEKPIVASRIHVNLFWL
jgi:3'-phosphoadenosine 5'-phosphosulfate sulfotransferase (PAPS reductase)/FAD synthetase